MVITHRHMSRRAVLKGVGVTMALPLLEAMIPARTAWARTTGSRTRLAYLEMVHGSAGCSAIGIKKNLWAPAGVGQNFDLPPSILSPLEPFREYPTIISNTDTRNPDAFTAPAIARDHFPPTPLLPP